MLLSIVTVTYNDQLEFAKTQCSLSDQKFSSDDVEWVVINGGDDIDIGDFKSCKVSYLCEPDSGIYNAMNKGARKATGKYLLYLNAGDTFFCELSLKSILELLRGNNNDIVFWNVNYRFRAKDLDWVWPGEINLERWLDSRNYPNHQGACIRRELQLLYPYDESLKIVSDMLFWTKLDRHTTSYYFDFKVLTNFELGGVSSSYSDFNTVYSHYIERKRINNATFTTLILFISKYILWHLIGPSLFYRVLKVLNNG